MSKKPQQADAATMARLSEIERVTNALLKIAVTTPREFEMVYKLGQKFNYPEGSLSEIYSAYVEKNAAIFGLLKHIQYNGIERPETIEEFEDNGGFRFLDNEETNIDNIMADMRGGK